MTILLFYCIDADIYFRNGVVFGCALNASLRFVTFIPSQIPIGLIFFILIVKALVAKLKI